LRIPHSLWGVSTDTSLARDIRIGEAQSPVGAALIDQAKRDQGFDSPMLHHNLSENVKFSDIFYIINRSCSSRKRYLTIKKGEFPLRFPPFGAIGAD